MGGDRLQRGQKDHHGRSELPHTQERNGEKRVAGVAKEVDRLEPQPGDHHVDQTDVGEDVAPEHRDRHRSTQDRGHIIGGAEEPDPLEPIVEHIGDQQREGELQRHRDEHIGERHLERPMEGAVKKQQLDIVGQPHPARIAQQRIIGKGEIEGCPERDRGEDHEADHIGHDIEQPRPFVLTAHRLSSPCRGPGRVRVSKYENVHHDKWMEAPPLRRSGAMTARLPYPLPYNLTRY